MKNENKNQNPLGTPNPKNPNILEWISKDGKRMLQYISTSGHYRICRSCDNGAWIVEKPINGRLGHLMKTLNKQWN